MQLILPTQKMVLKAFSALVDLAPGSTNYNAHVSYINQSTVYNPATGAKTLDGSVVYVSALNDMFAGVSTAELATSMLANLGLSSVFTQADGVAYLTANSANRVKAVLDLAEALSTYGGSDAAVLAAKESYNAALDLAYTYSSTAANTAVMALNDSVFTTFTLTTALDKMVGTAGIDTFVATTVLNANTLQDADSIDGGAGNDSLYVDLVAQTNAITPKLTNIESVIIRAQTTTGDATNGNNTSSGAFTNLVQIDAQRSLAVDVANHVTADVGVTRWESNNSRSDVVIEDVRIGNSQKTSDVTIAMVETDPGNVDFAVYFDQQSLRNAATGSTTLTLKLMDTGAAATAATAATPLLNNPYDLLKLGINGVLTEVQLDKAAVKAADTYEALVEVLKTALVGTGATVALGANFTITDPLSSKAVTGKTIVITGGVGAVITTPTGSGWFNTTDASVPTSSNIFTTLETGASSVTELVTSKVVLDDVGRSNMGGDLVIGGMSTGDTSSYAIYRGVERFEIEVRDNSKLQTINSTNNALREVTIVNGATSKTVADAYTTTVTNEGDLTVNGDANNIAWGGVNNGASSSGGNNDLPGVENNSPVGVHHGAGAAGFTDVRLIDASAFKGKLAFTAAITKDSVAKYMNLVDVAPALPAADIANSGNVNFGVRGANFIYTGGNDDDTMAVTIDATTASSRSSVVSGQSDFTFAFNGGAGNDAMTVTMINTALAGGAQAWYNNQKLNANIAIGAGDGDDTVRTPGAGDVIIDAGAGNDTVYTDNTGALALPVANGSASAAATAYTNAAAAELASALAAAVAANTTGFNHVAGSNAATAATSAAAAANLDTLNLVTPAGTHAAVTAAGGVIPTHSALIAAIDAATTGAGAGGLTFAQNIALNQAYGNWTTAGTVTPATTMVNQAITGSVATADATVVTAAQYDAGNALLETYITAAKAAAATETANVANAAAQLALLNTTQTAVLNATMAVNRVFDPSIAAPAPGLTYVAAVTTAGVNEINTFTMLADPAGGPAATIVINGATITESVAGAGFTAADAAAALIAGATVGTAAYAGANLAGWTVAAGVAPSTVAYTSTTTGNPANLVNTGTLVLAAPAETAATAELSNVNITGTGTAGETLTFDGVTYNVGGLTAVQVAALIDSSLPDTTYTDADAGGGVVNFTGVTLGNIANMVSGDFVATTVGSVAGTQTTVNNLAALNTALASGATDAQVVTALQAAIDNGSISVAQANALFAAAISTGAGSVVAAEVSNIALILTPLQTAAANANTAANTALTNAIAADVLIVNQQAQAAAADPVLAATQNIANPAAVNDAVGSTEAAAALVTATAAVTAQQAVLTPFTTQATNLATLKSAIALGATDLQVVTATTNAVANLAITAANKATIDAAAGAATVEVGDTVTNAEKTAVDLVITALQLTNETNVAANTAILANLTAVQTAVQNASTIAAAAAASGGAGVAEFAANQKAVFVFDTTNQTSTYNRSTMDDRNLADLRSDANNSNNFFNSTLKVTFKGIEASVVVAGTGYKTTDLELNQSIKLAINSDAVLSKLLLATDGPANTLVVTSLIDGAQVTGNLAVTVTMPTTVTAADLAGATTAYGLAAGSTEAQVLAAMTTAKAAFDAKGDYVTQFAESGAAGGNTLLVGANSTSSSDNTITLGTGNDVLVLGTTETTVDMMTSSNETVIYSGSFGNDTIVNFDVSGNGIDKLDFTALKGSGAVALNSLSLDKSIVIAAPAAVALTATQIAALFTDSATAINHVYVAVDSTNIGSIWQVADAAGTAAGNIVATLVGSIDLADTAWGTLTTANFA